VFQLLLLPQPLPLQQLLQQLLPQPLQQPEHGFYRSTETTQISEPRCLLIRGGFGVIRGLRVPAVAVATAITTATATARTRILPIDGNNTDKRKALFAYPRRFRCDP
jgi:hypothetical protein